MARTPVLAAPESPPTPSREPCLPVLLKVKVEGLECWSDSHRYDDRGEIVLLSVFGPRNAVRAAWARLMRDRKNGSVEVDDRQFHRGDADYTSMSSTLPRGVFHWALVHHDATHRVSPFAGGFYLVSPTPAQDFFPRLNRLCAMPFRPAWASELWSAGQQGEDAPIRPLPGHGVPGFYVSADVETWHRVVRDLIASGRIR